MAQGFAFVLRVGGGLGSGHEGVLKLDVVGFLPRHFDFGPISTM